MRGVCMNLAMLLSGPRVVVTTIGNVIVDWQIFHQEAVCLLSRFVNISHRVQHRGFVLTHSMPFNGVRAYFVFSMMIKDLAHHGSQNNR